MVWLRRYQHMKVDDLMLALGLYPRTFFPWMKIYEADRSSMETILVLHDMNEEQFLQCQNALSVPLETFALQYGHFFLHKPLPSPAGLITTEDVRLVTLPNSNVTYG